MPLSIRKLEASGELCALWPLRNARNGAWPSTLLSANLSRAILLRGASGLLVSLGDAMEFVSYAYGRALLPGATLGTKSVNTEAGRFVPAFAPTQSGLLGGVSFFPEDRA